jgi:hypothetical protein
VTVDLVAAGLAFVIAAAFFVSALGREFHAEFSRRAAAAVAAAGRHGDAPVGEEDLRALPEPLARWIRWSGAVGKPRPSVLRLVHGGRFKPAAKQGWRAIRGEYVITTRRPSFTWYGKLAIVPGIAVAAIDSYREGHGRMQVKALSAVKLVDARSPVTDRSAFARCLAELTMTPTFFLDRELVTAEQVGPDHVRCRVTDGAVSGDVDLFVNADGSLDRVEVLRPFERAGGASTLERFTGKYGSPRTWQGRTLGAHLDGVWNLPEGDLHYVAFEVENAEFE